MQLRPTWNVVPLILCGITSVLWLLTRTLFRKLDVSNEVVGLLLGVAPNLFAGFLLPMALVLRPSWEHRTRVARRFWLLSFGVLAWLCLEEFYPIVSASQVTDPHDIVASVLGVLLAAAVFYGIRPRLRFAGERDDASTAESPGGAT